jgi:hypothetical protein
LQNINLYPSENLAVVSHDDPIKSLSYVKQCNAFIGSDSGFKTMSAMSKIPTYVWLGDYIDEPRDKLHIDPYVCDGVMEVFRYKDVNGNSIMPSITPKSFSKGFYELCYFIRKNPNRLEVFLRNNQHLSFRTFKAIDGAYLTPVGNYSRGAMGNAMSHIELWRQCAAGTEPYTICEYDAELHQNFEFF